MSLILHLVACHALEVPSDNPFVHVVYVYSGAFLSKCFGDFPSPALLLVTAALVLPTPAAGPQWDSPVRAVGASCCRTAVVSLLGDVLGV